METSGNMAVADSAEYKDIRFVITSLWKRSADAEGNPMHKAQTREKIESYQQPVQVIPIEGITSVVIGIVTNKYKKEIGCLIQRIEQY